MKEMPILQVRDVDVVLNAHGKRVPVLDQVSFDLAPSEVLGIVGESGAGKSVAGAVLIDLLTPPLKRLSGEISLHDLRLDTLRSTQMRQIRGKRVGFIFQDPMISLNPVLSIGRQLVDTMRTHLRLDRHTLRNRAMTWIERVGLPNPERIFSSAPHQLSGGQRQRIVIALALCAEPDIVIADEPTTALDVSVQAQMLQLIRDLHAQTGAAMILITHDLAVIAKMADRVAVFYAGRIVEITQTQNLFNNPQHPYSAGLMAATPAPDAQGQMQVIPIEGAMPSLDQRPSGCAFHPRCPHQQEDCRRIIPSLSSSDAGAVACLYPLRGPKKWQSMSVSKSETKREPDLDAPIILQLENISKTYGAKATWFDKAQRKKPTSVQAVCDVSFSIKRGEVVGLVGESGCGKSTLARLIAGLMAATCGRIRFSDNRPRLQMVFQDPFSSLNGRWRVEDIIAEPIRTHRLRPRHEIAARVVELLEQVGLSAADGRKFPQAFSGGQRQRISIARALAGEPDFLILDEPTSALDVSVQAQILNILRDLQVRLGLTCLFITHNLSVVRLMADRIGVMYLGHMVEIGPAETIFTKPSHPYTKLLIQAAPNLDATDRRLYPIEGELPNPSKPPSGCRFRTRCPYVAEICAQETPSLRLYDKDVSQMPFPEDVLVRCHFPL